MGGTLGWTSSAFESMRENTSVPQLLDSEDDKSSRTWIGSSMTLGALVGAIISGNCCSQLQALSELYAFV